MKLSTTIVASVLLISAADVGAEPIINLSSTGNSLADNAFRLAADSISSYFSDDVAININAGFNSLEPGIIGKASSSKLLVDFQDWSAAISSDVFSGEDHIFASSLPNTSFSMLTNFMAENPYGAGSSSSFIDNDNSTNNNFVNLTRANAKSIGLLDPFSPDSDISIVFSSNANFDFDPTDGIDTGKIDFVSVAIHEIMHGLGFTSGVDALDYYSGNSPYAQSYSEDLFTFFSPLDFTRHSSDSYSAGVNADWTADIRDKYFSIDGGATVYADNAWSTGFYNGDGEQASHWKDNKSLGLMDPTALPGEERGLTTLDLMAMDVIGWDLKLSDNIHVPLPSTAFLFSLGALLLFYRHPSA